MAGHKESELKWYPVCTKARAEKKVAEALKSKGIEVYLPLHRQLKQWSDRKKWVEEPLIRSYLFVQIRELDKNIILNTKGVVRFIYFSGEIASMPERQIESLKLLMASPCELEITTGNLLPGEKVVVKAGPLKGLHGEVMGQRLQKTIIIRLESIGYSIIVHMAASYLGRL